MAYGERFKYYFYWDHKSTNNYYKVSFLEDGYASTVTTLTAGPNPFITSVAGQKDSIDQPILGSSAQMEFIVDRDDVDVIDPNLLNLDYKEVIVKLIEDPDGTPITKWVGIVFPSSTNRPYQGNKFTYQLTANDGLADLKKKSFSTNGKSYGSPYTGFENLLTIIKTAIEKLADFTELQLDFRIQLGTFSDQMISTENAYAENEVVQELFSEEKDGQTVFNSCYEVLEKVLKPFYCSMAQVDGYYWIWNKSERDTYYYEYDWATLTQQSRTSNDRTFTLFGVLSTKELFGKGSFSKVPGYAENNIILYNKNYDPELITNSGIDSNVTGWTNGEANGSANPWDALAWFNYVSVGGTMSLQWAGAAAAGSYHFHTTSTFTIEVGAGKQNVNVSIRIERFSETPAGLSSPNIRMRLYNATDGYVTGSSGYQSVGTIGGFTKYNEVFVVTGMTVAANYLDVEYQAVDTGTTSIQVYIDYVTAEQPSVNDPTDWQYRAILGSVENYEIKEQTLYIAERQESDNDICAIKDSGGTYTSTWNRYGLGTPEDLPLITILQQQIANANRGWKAYVRATIYDDDQELLLNSTIVDISLGLTTKYFDIVGITTNYRAATHEVQLKENGIIPTTDISVSQGHFKLTSQYGQSTD